MTEAPTELVVPHRPWLSQGDIFTKVPLLEAGVTKSAAVQALNVGPALLVTHDCTIDKKKGRAKHSALEYLSFVPIQSVAALDKERAARLRQDATALEPLPALYLGDVEKLGEAWVNLTRPYTVPSALFQTELRDFTDAETGEGDDRRIVATVHETRCSALAPDHLHLFRRKWTALWTRFVPAS